MTTRLSLLALLCLSLTAAAAEPARDDRAAEALGWKLANKAYTFRALTLMQTIEVTKALGLKYLEVNPGQMLSADQQVRTDHTLPAAARDQLIARMRELGVQAVTYGVVKFGDDEAAWRPVFQYAKQLGVGTLVAEPPVAAMPLLARLCAEYGMSVAIHNHPGPSTYATPESVLAAIAGHAGIGACADTGHWQRSDLSAVDCLAKLGSCVLCMHLKDTDGRGKQAGDVPLGSGVADVRAMLGGLHARGFKGVMALEYETAAAGDQLIAEVQQSIRFFDTVARELVAAGK